MNTQQSQSVQQLQIYGVVFNTPLHGEICNYLQEQDISEALKKKQWQINGFNQIDIKVHSIIPFIKQASCFELSISQFNQYQQDTNNIIQHISISYFLQLKQLFLGWNNITSIEQLQFVNMPLLEDLQLRNNKITKTYALNKCNWNHLRHISLFYNRTVQTNISRIKISNQTTDQIFFRGDRSGGDRQVLELMKLDIKNLHLWSSTYGIELDQRKLQSLEQKGLTIEFKKHRA